VFFVCVTAASWSSCENADVVGDGGTFPPPLVVAMKVQFQATRQLIEKGVDTREDLRRVR